MYCDICGRKLQKGYCENCMTKDDFDILGGDINYNEDLKTARASKKQIEYIISMMRQKGISESVINRKTWNLSLYEATRLINILKGLRHKELATDKQKSYIRDLLGQLKKSEDFDIDLISKERAIHLIETLQNKKMATPKQLGYLNDLIDQVGYSLSKVKEIGFEFEEDNGRVSAMSFNAVSKLIDLLAKELPQDR